MSTLHVHVLFEHGRDLAPFGSAHLRLLRPLRHPGLEGQVSATFGPEYDGEAVDAVVVDRLWRRDVSPALVGGLVDAVEAAGARLIYALDDNYLDLPVERLARLSPDAPDPADRVLAVVDLLLRRAHGVLVTTPALRERYAARNRNIAVLPHALDERLLIARGVAGGRSTFGPRRKVLGYMGTPSHDEDLIAVAPALRAVAEHHPGEIEFELIGGVDHDETLQALEGLPLRRLELDPEDHLYPRFMLRFTGHTRWDLAIAPLADTPFNRCKSDVKFLDYAAAGLAGIYSRTAAYESTVEHGNTGWLADGDDDWATALETLLADDDLRARLARNAARTLYGQRVLAVCAHRWAEALRQLLDEAPGGLSCPA